MSISHNKANIRYPTFSLCKVPRCLSTKLEAGYTGWKGQVSHRNVQSCQDKDLKQFALQRPQVVCDTTAMSS